MSLRILMIAAMVLGFGGFAKAADNTPAAKNAVTEKTSAGDLVIQPINHSALRFEFKGKQYYVDPAGTADWANMPKADFIFITHEHGDHLAPATIKLIQKEGVQIFANASSVKAGNMGTAIEHNQPKDMGDIKVTAVPAYNLAADRQQYHPKDRKDNGYVLQFGDKKVYVAGDTEGIPEMKDLKEIDIAFLPCNLPYTMDAKGCAEAAKLFKPKVLYPYHQGQTKPEDVKKNLETEKEIEVRILALP